MEILARGNAVENSVEGEMEESVCQMMGVLLEEHLEREEVRRSGYIYTLL
jgi:hypothetical protein